VGSSVVPVTSNKFFLSAHLSEFLKVIWFLDLLTFFYKTVSTAVKKTIVFRCFLNTCVFDSLFSKVKAKIQYLSVVFA